ncbi:MAG: IS66 family transposase, partial [Propionivibrio sp.]|nr:IS66 family transposase [Propionivibrio sp.]
MTLAMKPTSTDSHDSDSLKAQVASLNARIEALLAQNAELIAQNKALNEQIATQSARIAELEAQLGKPPKTPDNSSTPPSRGHKARGEERAAKPRRKGRPGAARALCDNPDVTRDLYAGRCGCGGHVGESEQHLVKAYDHIDLPPIKPITTRINIHGGICACCNKLVTATPPANMPEGSPFGPGIAAAVAYLHGCHMVGYKRLVELMHGMFGLTISQGAIANILRRVGNPFAVAAEKIAEEVRASEVIASDETSARVGKQTWWQWTFGCATAVYHVIAPTRAKSVAIDFLRGARPKVWLSDRYGGQRDLACAHQYCLAHLIRDARYAIDHGDGLFAPRFKAFLKDACAIGRKRKDITDTTIDRHRRRLKRDLDCLLRLEPTDAEGRHLRDAIDVGARDKLLVFLARRDVAPTNNESERALR